MEPTTLVCPHCHKRLKAPATVLGRSVKCPACGQAFVAKAAPAPAARAATAVDGPQQPPTSSTDQAQRAVKVIMAAWTRGNDADGVRKALVDSGLVAVEDAPVFMNITKMMLEAFKSGKSPQEIQAQVMEAGVPERVAMAFVCGLAEVVIGTADQTDGKPGAAGKTNAAGMPAVPMPAGPPDVPPSLGPSASPEAQKAGLLARDVAMQVVGLLLSGAEPKAIPGVLLESDLVKSQKTADMLVAATLVTVSGMRAGKPPAEIRQEILAGACKREDFVDGVMFGTHEALREAQKSEPPSAREVLARLMILKSVFMHAMTTPPDFVVEKMTEANRSGLDDELRKRAEANVARLKELDLWKHASPKEQEFLMSWGSRMDKQAQVDASWRAEAASMLGWALCAIDWPAIDREADKALLQQLPLENVERTASAPQLRVRRVIEKQRDRLELWHWRVRTREMIDKKVPFTPDAKMIKAGIRSLDDVVRMTASFNQQDKMAEVLDGDFAFAGKPFRTLSPEEFDQARSMIVERHYALNWLCGRAPGNRWDETPTDT